MSAVELFHQDGKTAGIWYCSECRVVHATETRATLCHGQAICSCGKPVERPGYKSEAICDACDMAARDAKRCAAESKRFAKAVKIPQAEYSGPVFADGIGPEWFEELDQYLEYVEDEEVAFPPYVWAAKPRSLRKVDTSDVTESLLDDMWEDADESDLNGVVELAEALDAFNAANESVVIFDVDYSRAVLLEVAAL